MSVVAIERSQEMSAKEECPMNLSKYSVLKLSETWKTSNKIYYLSKYHL